MCVSRPPWLTGSGSVSDALPRLGDRMAARRDANAAATALALSLLCTPGTASALAPDGGEIQVNTYTTDSQGAPPVASDSAGNFVFVWASFGGAWSDTSLFSVQGQ